MGDERWASRLPRRRLLRYGATVALAASAHGSLRVEANVALKERVDGVNTTDIVGAIRLGCETMGRVFNADDGDIPFFRSTVWPVAELAFNDSHTESHVPGRHLNALLDGRGGARDCHSRRRGRQARPRRLLLLQRTRAAPAQPRRDRRQADTASSPTTSAKGFTPSTPSSATGARRRRGNSPRRVSTRSTASGIRTAAGIGRARRAARSLAAGVERSLHQRHCSRHRAARGVLPRDWPRSAARSGATAEGKGGSRVLRARGNVRPRTLRDAHALRHLRHVVAGTTRRRDG